MFKIKNFKFFKHCILIFSLAFTSCGQNKTTQQDSETKVAAVIVPCIGPQAIVCGSILVGATLIGMGIQYILMSDGSTRSISSSQTYSVTRTNDNRRPQRYSLWGDLVYSNPECNFSTRSLQPQIKELCLSALRNIEIDREFRGCGRIITDSLACCDTAHWPPAPHNGTCIW